MPTYDYSCDNCGHEFEREQRITEKPLRKCPKCGKDEARRMIGGGGFILKGGGWESGVRSLLRALEPIGEWRQEQRFERVFVEERRTEARVEQQDQIELKHQV
jgi:putative FmdB family regulatory protein